MKGAKMFSEIDLRSSNHQVKVKEEDILKSTFMIRYGNYEFTIVPFGLINAPTTFMFLMNNVFNKYLHKFVLVLLDDFLVYYKIE